MIIEYSQQDVEVKLAQSLESGELRQILSRQGILMDEPVLLNIKINGVDIVQNYVIPTTSTPISLAKAPADFKGEMTIFLDNTEISYGLLTALYPGPVGEGKHIDCNYIFTISPDKKLEFVSGICKRPLPPHIC